MRGHGPSLLQAKANLDIDTVIRAWIVQLCVAREALDSYNCMLNAYNLAEDARFRKME